MLNLFKSKPKPGYLGLTALGLMLMAALWWGAGPAGAQENKADAGAKAGAATATTNTTANTTTAAAEKTPVDVEELKKTCKGLKPYENLDELLYQFYINLESDCLFEMTTAELEEAWGIKILDEERARPINYYPLSETEFYNKPYKSEKDAFYVKLTHDEHSDLISTFQLKPTKDAFEKKGTLFTNNQLPQLLPPPNGSSRYDSIIPVDIPGKPGHYRAAYGPCNFPHYSHVNSGQQNEDCYSYVWQSQDGNQAITLENSDEIIISRRNQLPEKNHSNAAKQNQAPPNNQPSKADADAANAPCRGLKPYENLTDLLYQIYINLDSDCLFKMPVEDLEKIWDTKILTDDIDKHQDPNSQEFRNKPYKSERDIFYIIAFYDKKPHINRFMIRTTRAYGKDKGRFYPYGKMPLVLPKMKKGNGFVSWLNSNKTRKIDITTSSDIWVWPVFTPDAAKQ